MEFDRCVFSGSNHLVRRSVDCILLLLPLLFSEHVRVETRAIPNASWLGS